MEKLTIFLAEINYQEFKNKEEIKELNIEERHLKIIFDILKNNLFATTDSHYYPVLFNTIKNKTSTKTCLKIKKLFLNDYFNISSNF